jgi:DtxR family transcriptional regulator, Mn-dependent transcriptional regulator
MGGNLSSTMLDYLAEVYCLSEDAAQQNKGFVSTSALADLLDVSAPAVNRMVAKLRDMDMLIHEPYQGIKLTPTGEREALRKLRYRRIAEVFLVKVMGFQWHEIHEEASRMSSAFSDIIADRMLEMSDFPTHCPHGEPIPTADGQIVEPDDTLMTEAPTGVELIVTRVRTREPDRLEYIAALGLMPGTHLEVMHAAPFNGPLQLKLAEEYRIIGHNLAELIQVKAP